MLSKIKMIHLLKLVAILLLVTTPAAMAAPSCTRVTSEVVSCILYIRGGNAPSKTCCGGVVAVANMMNTKLDKIAVCNCIKTALKPIGAYDPSRIPLLSKSCGAKINLPYIDQNYDCSKISLEGVS